MMSNLSHLTTRKRLLATLTAGALLGLLASAPATAVTFTTTATVVGHKPSLTTAENIKYTDVNDNHLLDEGDTLEVGENNFTFSDADGDVSSGTTFEWFVDDASQAASATTNSKYTVKAGDVGKKISVKGTPHTSPLLTDPAAGEPVKAKFSVNTQTGDEVQVIQATDVVSVELSAAIPTVNEALIVTPKCQGGSDCDAGKLKYKWEIEGLAGQYTEISTATGATYTPAKGDQKKHIRVSVWIEGSANPAPPLPTETRHQAKKRALLKSN